jgi:hypothetical protein
MRIINTVLPIQAVADAILAMINPAPQFGAAETKGAPLHQFRHYYAYPKLTQFAALLSWLHSSIPCICQHISSPKRHQNHNATL